MTLTRIRVTLQTYWQKEVENAVPTIDDFVSIQELSQWLNIPVPTLYDWVHRKRIPFIKLGRLLRFDREAIRKWIFEKSVESINLKSA